MRTCVLLAVLAGSAHGDEAKRLVDWALAHGDTVENGLDPLPPPSAQLQQLPRQQRRRAIQRLAAALTSERMIVRAHAAELLGACEPAELTPLVPRLVAALSSPDSDVRLQAARALDKAGALDKAAALEPRWQAELDDPDPQVQLRGARALALLDEHAAPAAAALAAKLHDPDPALRIAALVALGSIGAAAEPHVGQIAELAFEPAVAEAAVRALGQLHRFAGAVVPTLSAHATDARPERRVAALNALAQLCDTADPAIPVIVRALGDPDPRGREAAAQALNVLMSRRVPPGASAAAPALAALLRDGGSSAFYADVPLRKLAAGSPAAMQRLVDLWLREKNAHARFILRDRGVRAAAVGLLVRASREPDAKVRARALELLGDTGDDGRAALGELVDHLADGDAAVREEARKALIGQRALAAETLPRLVALLRGKDPLLRRRAADVLFGLGDAARPAVAALVERLDDSDEAVRQSAALALDRIGGYPPAAEPRIKALCDDFRRNAPGM